MTMTTTSKGRDPNTHKCIENKRDSATPCEKCNAGTTKVEQCNGQAFETIETITKTDTKCTICTTSTKKTENPVVCLDREEIGECDKKTCKQPVTSYVQQGVVNCKCRPRITNKERDCCCLPKEPTVSCVGNCWVNTSYKSQLIDHNCIVTPYETGRNCSKLPESHTSNGTCIAGRKVVTEFTYSLENCLIKEHKNDISVDCEMPCEPPKIHHECRNNHENTTIVETETWSAISKSCEKSSQVRESKSVVCPTPSHDSYTCDNKTCIATSKEPEYKVQNCRCVSHINEIKRQCCCLPIPDTKQCVKGKIMRTTTTLQKLVDHACRTIGSTKVDAAITCPNDTITYSDCHGGSMTMTKKSYEVKDCKCEEDISNQIISCKVTCPNNTETLGHCDSNTCLRTKTNIRYQPNEQGTKCINTLSTTSVICCELTIRSNETCDQNTGDKIKYTRRFVRSLKKNSYIERTTQEVFPVICPPPKVTVEKCGETKPHFRKVTTINFGKDCSQCACQQTEKTEFEQCSCPPPKTDGPVCLGDKVLYTKTTLYHFDNLTKTCLDTVAENRTDVVCQEKKVKEKCEHCEKSKIEEIWTPTNCKCKKHVNVVPIPDEPCCCPKDVKESIKKTKIECPKDTITLGPCNNVTHTQLKTTSSYTINSTTCQCVPKFNITSENCVCPRDIIEKKENATHTELSRISYEFIANGSSYTCRKTSTVIREVLHTCPEPSTLVDCEIGPNNYRVEKQTTYDLQQASVNGISYFECAPSVTGKRIHMIGICNQKGEEISECINFQSMHTQYVHKNDSCECSVLKTPIACDCERKNYLRNVCNATASVMMTYTHTFSAKGHTCVETIDSKNESIRCDRPHSVSSSCVIGPEQHYTRNTTTTRYAINPLSCKCEPIVSTKTDICSCKQEKTEKSCQNEFLMVSKLTKYELNATSESCEKKEKISAKEVVCEKASVKEGLCDTNTCLVTHELVSYNSVNCMCEQKITRKETACCCKVDSEAVVPLGNLLPKTTVCHEGQIITTEQEYKLKVLEEPLFPLVPTSPRITQCMIETKIKKENLTCAAQAITRCDCQHGNVNVLTTTLYMPACCKCVKVEQTRQLDGCECKKSEVIDTPCVEGRYETVLTNWVSRKGQCVAVEERTKKVCKCPESRSVKSCNNGVLTITQVFNELQEGQCLEKNHSKSVDMKAIRGVSETWHVVNVSACDLNNGKRKIYSVGHFLNLGTCEFETKTKAIQEDCKCPECERIGNRCSKFGNQEIVQFKCYHLHDGQCISNTEERQIGIFCSPVVEESTDLCDPKTGLQVHRKKFYALENCVCTQKKIEEQRPCACPATKNVSVGDCLNGMQVTVQKGSELRNNECVQFDITNEIDFTGEYQGSHKNTELLNFNVGKCNQSTCKQTVKITQASSRTCLKDPKEHQLDGDCCLSSPSSCTDIPTNCRGFEIRETPCSQQDSKGYSYKKVSLIRKTLSVSDCKCREKLEKETFKACSKLLLVGRSMPSNGLLFRADQKSLPHLFFQNYWHIHSSKLPESLDS
ncbi:hypothetical protein Ciccas_003790 [Cichlidogyrus casuarinus]|uniref:Uncharacterized protein n=1 Tax=Cichlidogyrus casuarinus TaxID=1844966 RepID=A0ABD2QDC9_9PLAT